MYRNEQYQKNVDSAIEELSTAESSLTSVNDQLQNINSLVIKAVNGTNNDETSRKIFSKTLDESKAIIQIHWEAPY
jgi:flagellin-like hook-associated protein FlgL